MLDQTDITNLDLLVKFSGSRKSIRSWGRIKEVLNRELAQQHLTQAKAAEALPEGEICGACNGWVYDNGKAKYPGWQYCPMCGRKLPLA